MRTFFKFSLIAISGFATVISTYGQTSNRDTPQQYFGTVIGPRVGVTYVVTSTDDFNDRLQEEFPDSDRTYRPIFSQFGIHLERRVQLGETDNAFLLQGVFLIGGMDQALIIPSLSGFIGFRFANGFEFGLGPNMTPGFRDSDDFNNGDDVGLNLGIVFAAGYTFNFQNVFVPINLAVVPPSGDNSTRLSILTGFNFRR